MVSTPATPAGRRLPAASRRRRRTGGGNGLYRAVAFLTTFAMLFGGLLLMAPAASAASPSTTDFLNLRTGPGIDHDVILVIPDGASISVDGDLDNGYYPVTYDGTSGYASSDYITFAGNAGSGDRGPAVSGGGPAGSAWVATDRLNFRSGPSLDDGVMWVLANGTRVELTGSQSNSYWQAVVDGTTGWLAAEYLTTNGAPSAPDPDPAPAPDTGDDNGGAVPVSSDVTGTATVTSGLNLRMGPSTGYDVVRVLPSGATVELRGNPQGGYFPVSYEGATGWAHGDWLRAAGAANPDPDPAPDTGNDNGGAVPVGNAVTGTATVTSGLNLRTGPSTGYDVIQVLPAGVTVELRGAPQGGYFPVSFNGATGWAHGDWLRAAGAASPDPDPAPAPDTGNDNGGAVPVGSDVTGNATVTSGLNLRMGPSTGYDVVRVLPSGATVELRGNPQGGYFPVSFNGATGWAHGDWLRAAGAASPDPDPAPDTGNGATPKYLYTSAAVNLRSGPSASNSVVWVIPPNTRVTITGDPRAGYYPASWAHVSGWLHGDFLDTSYDGPPSGHDDMIAIIHEAADFYGQPREDMVRVAECESHFDPNAVNPASGTSGLFQFRPSTWATTPFADEDIFDARANAYAAAWMWSVGRRNEWACQ